MSLVKTDSFKDLNEKVLHTKRKTNIYEGLSYTGEKFKSRQYSIGLGSPSV